MTDFRPRPGSWKRASVLAVVVLLAGCNYGLRGGGFPEHIRTIYIESFENRTPQFELEQQIFTAMLDRVPSALGVQVASRTRADALLTGTILGYDVAYRVYTPAGYDTLTSLPVLYLRNSYSSGWRLPHEPDELIARTRRQDLFLLTVVAICFGTAWVTSAKASSWATPPTSSSSPTTTTASSMSTRPSSGFLASALSARRMKGVSFS